MTKTFDTSRVGGGTYELALDANGNYNLNSVGFDQVNKLNLPDLKTSDTTSVADTTKKATEDTIKAQTTEVFKPSNVYQSGGDGQGANTQSMVKDAKVNEATVRQAGEMTNTTYNQMTDDEKEAVATGTSGMTFRGAETSVKNPSIGFGQGQVDPSLAKAAGMSSTIDTTKTYKTPRTITDQNKFLGRTFTDKTTGLQTVRSKAIDVIDSVKNNKAIQYASTALGILKGGFGLGVNLLSKVLPKTTQDDKHRRGYFNMDPPEQGGRISGNPATDLYAGFNAVSAFGNLEKAGQKRISKRESIKTQARISKLSPEKQKKYNDATQGMKEQQRDYVMDRMKDRVSKNKEKGINAREAGITNKNKDGTTDGSGGQGNQRVICTELHRTKDLSTRDWIRDTKFTFKTLSKTHVKGYLLWAEPTVKHMQKYPKYRKVWKHIAQHRANDIAWRLNEGKFDLLGRIYAGIGEPVCWALGNFVSNKQLNKYNTSDWRKA